MAEPRHRRAQVEAVVWRRQDFRESSRVVTLFTRELGPIAALAKGAHRPTSPFLGRLDWLNHLRVTLSPDRGGLRLLVRAELLRERRALREPRRFLAASHLAGTIDAALFRDRAEPELFDLLTGGLNLLERCPDEAIGIVSMGLEVRFLAWHGILPDLHRCTGCGAGLGPAWFGADGGLCCSRHAGTPRRALAAGVLALLRALRDEPGRNWPDLAPDRSAPAAAEVLRGWVQRATERACRARRQLWAGRGPGAVERAR